MRLPLRQKEQKRKPMKELLKGGKMKPHSSRPEQSNQLREEKFNEQAMKRHLSKNEPRK